MNIPLPPSSHDYDASVATASVHDVAAELRRRLPGVGVTKLHKLLYYCQGHHLAQFDTPLFGESLMAYDHGPLVAQLWWSENHSEPAPEPISLDRGQANTIAYVVSRYGQLTGGDLERLTHHEPPWQIADQYREPGGSVRIELDDMRRFFTSTGAQDEAVPPAAAARVSAWLRAAAEPRPAGELHADSDEEILERLRALA